MTTTIKKPGRSIKQVRTVAAVEAVAKLSGLDALKILKVTSQPERVRARMLLAVLLLDDVGLKKATVQRMLNYVHYSSATYLRARALARRDREKAFADDLRRVREVIKD